MKTIIKSSLIMFNGAVGGFFVGSVLSGLSAILWTKMLLFTAPLFSIFVFHMVYAIRLFINEEIRNNIVLRSAEESTIQLRREI